MTPANDQYAPPRDSLTHTAYNSALYAALTGSAGVHEICEQMGCAVSGYRLVRVDDRLGTVGGNEFEIALVDDISASVAYYDKVRLVHFPSINSRHVARCEIWRSADMRHSEALRDISQKVLFSYLIQYYDILLDEAELTGSGRFYWHRQVSRAIHGGFYVYLYELATQEFQAIPTQRALIEIEDRTWSSTSEEPLRALISIINRAGR